MEASKLLNVIRSAMEGLEHLEIDEQVSVINDVRELLHQFSPFQEDPVDLVRWVQAESVVANDYNPNKVAPPEMELLEHSIREDGFTQPIVAYEEGDGYTVVDGFHRQQIGKDVEDIRERLYGYLPIVVIDKPINERMASTIRHNRARGTHGIMPMTEVIERLYLQGWSMAKIGRELGMEKDEVLRLKQTAGLGLLFQGKKYSQAWE